MNKIFFRILLIAGIVIGLLFLMRMAWAFRVLVVVAIVGLAGYLIWALLQGIRASKEEKRLEASLAGQIGQRLQYCREQWSKNEEEMKRIKDHLSELLAVDNPGKPLGEANRKERSDLVKGFQSELKLRQAKSAFFKRAMEKLETMVHNQHVSTSLAQKKEELKRLQETNYEDLAELEELRSTMEMDVLHLKTIEELSSRILDSSSVDHALALREELEEMTKDLDQL